MVEEAYYRNGTKTCFASEMSSVMTVRKRRKRTRNKRFYLLTSWKEIKDSENGKIKIVAKGGLMRWWSVTCD
jgi:hypothetical protein